MWKNLKFFLHDSDSPVQCILLGDQIFDFLLKAWYVQIIVIQTFLHAVLLLNQREQSILPSATPILLSVQLF